MATVLNRADIELLESIVPREVFQRFFAAYAQGGPGAVDPSDVDTIRDFCADEAVLKELDATYAPTERGRALEQLVDKLFQE